MAAHTDITNAYLHKYVKISTNYHKTKKIRKRRSFWLVSIVGTVTAMLKWLYFRKVSAFYYEWLAEMCKWSDIMNNTNSSFDIFYD